MHPGAPFIYGGICSSLDMRTMRSPQSSPESCLCTAGYACMARYYGIPSQVWILQTSSKAVDYQAGFETAMGALTAALSGIDLILGAGLMDDFLGVSNEKLAMDCQFLEYIKAIAGGIQVDENTLAEAEIKEVGCGDKITHTTTDHTFEWFRSQQCWPGPIVDRDSHEQWKQKGMSILDRTQAVIDEANAAASTADPQALARVKAVLDQIERFKEEQS
jgi:trimethylamine--corrinoid protein Co-methyltransferase